MGDGDGDDDDDGDGDSDEDCRSGGDVVILRVGVRRELMASVVSVDARSFATPGSAVVGEKRDLRRECRPSASKRADAGGDLDLVRARLDVEGPGRLPSASSPSQGAMMGGGAPRALAAHSLSFALLSASEVVVASSLPR